MAPAPACSCCSGESDGWSDSSSDEEDESDGQASSGDDGEEDIERLGWRMGPTSSSAFAEASARRRAREGWDRRVETGQVAGPSQ